jgi:hypothetical protein
MNGPHADWAGPCLEAPKTSKVLVIVYNPYHPMLQHDEATHGNAVIDPVVSSHQLVDIYRQVTHGLVNYEISEIRYVNGKPPQGTPMPGNTADYGAIFTQNNICSLIQNQNLSEVWIWGDNDSGFDELAYKVPGDNIPNKAMEENPWLYDYRTKNIPDCGKTIIAMGWNFMVGLDNIVHTHSHLIESIVSMTVGRGRFMLNVPDPSNPQPTDPLLDPTNPWSLYSRWDTFQLVPHQAAVGTTHFPPNAPLDPTTGQPVAYDYSDTVGVMSTAADWLNYPFLTGAKTSVDCTAWGCDQLSYQEWYETHLPHAAGTSYGGMCNNWWTYVADYDRRNPSCSGTSCLQPIGGLCGQNDECASGTCACGQCVATGSNPTCPGAAFAPCTAASQCGSGICGCPGETGTRVCLPDSTYVSTCLQPNGGPCWGDADCASGVCGCNGGSILVCQPAGSSRACSGIGNWSACLNGSECVSGFCGCQSGHHPLVCLPSNLYDPTCLN